MEIRRFKDIIAVQTDTIPELGKQIIAFHANNLELAEVSDEVFSQMSPINIADDYYTPLLNLTKDSESYKQLTNWNDEYNPNVSTSEIKYGIRNLTINVNQICNLKCKYCAAGGDGTYGDPTLKISIEATLPQIKFFINKAPNDSVFAISIVGGEPLLYVDAIEAIYNYAHSLTVAKNIKLKFKLVTNGTLIDDRAAAILTKMNLDLTISMDGSKTNNDLSRPSKDGSSTTDRILLGLDKLKKNRGSIKSIHITAVVTKDNSDLFGNFMYIYNLGPDTFDFSLANEETDEATVSKYITEYRKIMEFLWSKNKEIELRRLKSVNFYFLTLDNQRRIENFCGSGKNYLMIDSKNNLYSCVWDVNHKNERIGKDTTIEQEKISNLSESLIKLNNCATCWARYICGGGCMYINKIQSSGYKHKKSAVFCRQTRSLILSTLMYYKMSRG